MSATMRMSEVMNMTKYNIDMARHEMVMWAWMDSNLNRSRPVVRKKRSSSMLLGCELASLFVDRLESDEKSKPLLVDGDGDEGDEVDVWALVVVVAAERISLLLLVRSMINKTSNVNAVK